jgi:hypothetical protein
LLIALAAAHRRYDDAYDSVAPQEIAVGSFVIVTKGWSLRNVSSREPHQRLTVTATSVGTIEYGANVATGDLKIETFSW